MTENLNYRMNLSTEQLNRLKNEGFKWFKENCTDRVDPEVIETILPAANGFTFTMTMPYLLRARP